MTNDDPPRSLAHLLHQNTSGTDMRIPVGDSLVTKSDVFKTVWRGWFFGVLVIFLPVFALTSLIALLGGGGDDRWEMAFGVLLVPLIAAGQGVLAGGLVLLGLSVAPPRRK